MHSFVDPVERWDDPNSCSLCWPGDPGVFSNYKAKKIGWHSRGWSKFYSFKPMLKLICVNSIICCLGGFSCWNSIICSLGGFCCCNGPITSQGRLGTCCADWNTCLDGIHVWKYVQMRLNQDLKLKHRLKNSVK